MEVIKKTYPSRYVATVRELAQQYKYEGLCKYRAWNQFITDRALKPELDRKDFWLIFNNALPVELIKLEIVPFKATHYDSLRNNYVQATVNQAGVFEMLWEDGATGSNPPLHPPDKERYLSVEY